MRRARRLAVSLLVLALSGCGLSMLGQPAVSPSPLPSDRMVFMVESFGGLIANLDSVLVTPALAVYGDGRVIEVDHDQHIQGTPSAYTVAQVDPAAVAAFVADAEERNVINEGTDFGDPMVTDMPVTTVQLHGTADPQLVHVYAFSDEFEDDVPRAQRRARQELAQIVDNAYALPGKDQRVAYRPDQVEVTQLQLDKGNDTPGPEWPGPDPESFLVPSADSPRRVACGTITGSNAEEAYAAARGNPRGVWTHGSRTLVLLVVPLLPGQPACS